MSQPRSRLAALAALLALVALLPPAAAAAPTAWSVDGTVTSMARVGGTLYIGGQFSRLGATTGPAVLVARADGLPTGRSPRVEGTAGRFITSAIADGAGGAYVAGDFLSVDGVGRVDVAYVLADGSLDPAFAVATDASAVVYGLALAGDDLYLGGTFTSVNGTARSRIARVDATTGALAAWNPGADDVVRAFLEIGRAHV